MLPRYVVIFCRNTGRWHICYAVSGTQAWPESFGSKGEAMAQREAIESEDKLYAIRERQTP